MKQDTQTMELSFGKAGFELTDTGIEIKKDMTLEEWSHGLKAFKWMLGRVKEGFSDYVSYGRKKFGDVKVDLEIQQLEFTDLEVKVSMAIDSVPKEMRLPSLEAAHYVVLAKADIPKQEKVEWAKKASEQKLSASQLKASIVQGEVVDPAAARSLTHGIVTIHGVSMEFGIALRKVGGLEGILKMEEDAQKEWLENLRPMGELYNQLVEHFANQEAVPA